MLRREEANEVKNFVAQGRSIQGNVDETRVLDCRFTACPVPDERAGDKVKFITLRKRDAKRIEETLLMPDKKGEKVYPGIPKRKYKRVSVCESDVTLKGCQHRFRQRAIKDPGRRKPTFMVTRHHALPLNDVLEALASGK